MKRFAIALAALAAAASLASANDPWEAPFSEVPPAILLYSGGKEAPPAESDTVLLVCDLAFLAEESAGDGWTKRTYANGRFEIRSTMTGSDLASGVLLYSGRLDRLTTLLDPALCAGRLEGTLELLAWGAGAHYRGERASLAGNLDAGGDALPSAAITWTSLVPEDATPVSTRSWGRVKNRFR